jgi:hypothetical protein
MYAGPVDGGARGGGGDAFKNCTTTTPRSWAPLNGHQGEQAIKGAILTSPPAHNASYMGVAYWA